MKCVRWSFHDLCAVNTSCYRQLIIRVMTQQGRVPLILFPALPPGPVSIQSHNPRLHDRFAAAAVAASAAQ